jgi:hypothetical protein
MKRRKIKILIMISSALDHLHLWCAALQLLDLFALFEFREGIGPLPRGLAPAGLVLLVALFSELLGRLAGAPPKLLLFPQALRRRPGLLNTREHGALDRVDPRRGVERAKGKAQRAECGVGGKKGIKNGITRGKKKKKN